MKVNGGNQGPIRPDRTAAPDERGPRALPVEQPRQEPQRRVDGREGLDRAPDAGGPRALPVGKPKVEDTAQVEKRDRVEISDAGRARAAKLERLSQLDPERVAELRRRILSGAYDADEVVAEVARRLIERGDV